MNCALRAGLCASLMVTSTTMAAVWPQFAGTPGNTASVAGTPPPDLARALVTNSPFLGVKMSSGVAVNYGRAFVYANGATGTIYCLDADDLTVKWAAPVPVDDSFGWGSWATPCVMNSSVVFAADSYLGCWNLNGSLRWQTTLARETVNSSPVIAGHRVIVGCFSYMNLDGGVGAYDLQTGSQVWFTVTTPNNTFSSCTPAVDESAGRVFVACSNQVTCLDAATGAIVWQASGPGARLQFNNVSMASGVVLAVNYDFTFGDTNLFAFNAANGTFLWAAACGMSDVPPAVDGNIVIHACGDNLVPPAITAFDLHTGAQVWQRPGLGSMYVPPAGAGGIVYAAVGVYSGWSLLTMSNLTALSAQNGSVLSATGNTRGGQAPAIADDIVYTANDGVVYAYRWPAGEITFKTFAARINTAVGGKDTLKFSGILQPYFPAADLGQLVYMRIGDFVVQGTPLSFVPAPDRPYAFSSRISVKKGVPLLTGRVKNGVYAGMAPYLSTGGAPHAAVPVTLITASNQYFRSVINVQVKAKKGKLSTKALPPNIK